ncbi:hypothetical protein Hypma_004128 [Hypsizygus marmoreus]|uniref:Uncharacterized protein n=1 Tax=Hypsizygus marmoreus TaxID=39966 RepID=A0A369J0P6_HYPMA|nr:hypothetical protein Hypma_004128 [Hypsizygus marmoreus]
MVRTTDYFRFSRMIPHTFNTYLQQHIAEEFLDERDTSQMVIALIHSQPLPAVNVQQGVPLLEGLVEVNVVGGFVAGLYTYEMKLT